MQTITPRQYTVYVIKLTPPKYCEIQYRSVKEKYVYYKNAA